MRVRVQSWVTGAVPLPKGGVCGAAPRAEEMSGTGAVRRARVGMVRAVALAAVTGLVASIAPAAHAAEGVVPTGSAVAVTVRIEIAGDPATPLGQTRERACSGALVGASWVITAASCFASSPGAAVAAGAPAWVTTATVGRPDLATTTGQVVKVDRLVPHPDRDVVLAHLATPVTSTVPVTVATTPATVGDAVTVTGYGRSAAAVVPGTVRAAAYSVVAVGARTLDIAPAQSGGAICKGDAGGPALRTTPSGGVELVGLHHTAYQGGCLGTSSTRRDATESRVDDLASWIGRSMAPKPGEAGFNEAYVAALYRDVLRREATPDRVGPWIARLDAGATLRDITNGIVDSLTWRRVFVTDQSRQLLRREPTVAQRDMWVARFDAGMDTFAIKHLLVGSAEYYAIAGSTDTGLIQTLYRDLLGRAPQSSEVSFWRSQIATSGRDALLRAIVYSEEHTNRVVVQLYHQMLGRSPDAPNLRTFADVLRNGGNVQELLVRLAMTSEYRNDRVWAP